MIRYALRCDRGHGFDSWFASSAAFDSLRAAGQVECPYCGSRQVDKTLMAPAVATPAPEAPKKTREQLIAERLAAFRRHVEETADYVGVEFVSEARAIHEGTAPDRPIWGEARPDEARALIEEGLPVAPLPFGPRRPAN
jgi:hypothetical protein